MARLGLTWASPFRVLSFAATHKSAATVALPQCQPVATLLVTNRAPPIRQSIYSCDSLCLLTTLHSRDWTLLNSSGIPVISVRGLAANPKHRAHARKCWLRFQRPHVTNHSGAVHWMMGAPYSFLLTRSTGWASKPPSSQFLLCRFNLVRVFRLDVSAHQFLYVIRISGFSMEHF